MIGYDDWWVLPCTTPGFGGTSIEALGGEARAHFEIAQKYAVSFECVCGPCTGAANLSRGWRTYFAVRNGSGADAGFAMDASAVARFLATNAACVAHRTRRHVARWVV
jgi:hypothetical protein